MPDADTGESTTTTPAPRDAKSISTSCGRDAGAHSAHDDYRRVHRPAGPGEPDLRRPVTGPGNPGSLPVVYVVLTLVFLAVAVGVCYRTVLNGLKALFAFNANSDSAAAVAAWP